MCTWDIGDAEERGMLEFKGVSEEGITTTTGSVEEEAEEDEVELEVAEEDEADEADEAGVSAKPEGKLGE